MLDKSKLDQQRIKELEEIEKYNKEKMIWNRT